MVFMPTIDELHTFKAEHLCILLSIILEDIEKAEAKGEKIDAVKMMLMICTMNELMNRVKAINKKFAEQGN